MTGSPTGYFHPICNAPMLGAHNAAPAERHGSPVELSRWARDAEKEMKISAEPGPVRRPEERHLPTEEMLAILPEQARMLFAARCVRRAASVAKDPLGYGRDDVEAVILLAESPGSATVEEAWRLYRTSDRYSMELDHTQFTTSDTRSGVYLASAASEAAATCACFLGAESFVGGSSRWAYLTMRSAASAVYWASNEKGLASVATGIADDYRVLESAVQSGAWATGLSLSLPFYPLHAQFATSTLLRGQTIIEVADAVSDQIIRSFLHDPAKLYSLSPLRFEELVARLFEGFGFDVTLTTPTRDNGRDVIAVSHRIVRAKYLIECKRYARRRTVGIAAVQRLHGVAAAEEATKGILVTTSEGFSGPAAKHLSQHPWILEGRAFDGLLEWLRIYDRMHLSGNLGLEVGGDREFGGPENGR